MGLGFVYGRYGVRLEIGRILLGYFEFLDLNYEIMKASYDIKKVSSSGQIMLGKHWAGKFFRIEKKFDGTMVLTPVIDIPESQLWVFQEPDKSKILAAVAWAEQHPAQVTALDQLFEKVGIKPESLNCSSLQP